jgi:hypothetical protein
MLKSWHVVPLRHSTLLVQPEQMLRPIALEYLQVRPGAQSAREMQLDGAQTPSAARQNAEVLVSVGVAGQVGLLALHGLPQTPLWQMPPPQSELEVQAV